MLLFEILCNRSASFNYRSVAVMPKLAVLCRNNVLTLSSRSFTLTTSNSRCTDKQYTRSNAASKASFRKTVVDFPIERIRNIGIMAHIDAGKTTTTERMLYLTGEITSCGSVDDGTTSTDYLEQERERGISITAAAVTMHWNSNSLISTSQSTTNVPVDSRTAQVLPSKASSDDAKAVTRINLIDTPGHVDFTIEVERSLRVVDAAIALIDSSAGVEAQTVTVWRQADRYALPRIAFMNKMDKPNADFHSSVESLRRRLNATPLVIQLPIGVGASFRGVVDVLTGDALLFDSDASQGSSRKVGLERNVSYRTVSYAKEADQFETICGGASTRHSLLAARRSVLELCAEHDPHFAEEFLAGDFDERSFHHELIAALKRSVRRLTLDDALASRSSTQDADEPFRARIVPVLCGSAKRCIAVHQLLDAVVDYLPSPVDRRHAFMDFYQPDDCVALVFKVIGEAQLRALGDASANQRGALALLRVFSGSLRSGQALFNLSRSESEKVARLFAVSADSFTEVNRADRGNVVAVSGLANAVTGDTLVASHAVATRALKNYVTQQQRLAVGESLINPDSVKPVSVELCAESNRPILAAMAVPDPVFVCTCEPPTVAQMRTLQHALACLIREDPSLRVSTDPETQQTLLHGMGELHLEIIRDRLKREYGIEVRCGPLQIAYREQPTAFAECTSTVEADLGGNRAVSVTLSVTPNDTIDEVPRRLHLVSSRTNSSPGGAGSLPNATSNWASLHPFAIEAMNKGISALRSGPLLRFPVVRCDVNAHAIAFDRPSTAGAHSLVTAAVADCLRKCLAQASMRILEPCAELEITTTRRKLGLILQDLSRRRAAIHHHTIRTPSATQTDANEQSTGFDPESAIVSVFARCPLSQLRRYSTELRILASGEATFAMRLAGYLPLDAKRQQELLDKCYLRETF